MKRAVIAVLLIATPLFAQRTQKPPLHGAHWMAITGKPLAATAGAMIFQRGGNAVDAAAAMIAATCTMWDTLSWGGETQALIYNPNTKQVTGINALGVAPTGATAEFFHGKGMRYPPEYGPLAAVTPGTPGGILGSVGVFKTVLVGGKDQLGVIGSLLVTVAFSLVIYYIAVSRRLPEHKVDEYVAEVYPPPVAE